MDKRLRAYRNAMKNWAWLVPCWVWKYFFAQLPRERVLLDGRSRFLLRLDGEFALVYDPQGEPVVSTVEPILMDENTPTTEPTRVFVLSKSRALYPARYGGTSP